MIKTTSDLPSHGSMGRIDQNRLHRFRDVVGGLFALVVVLSAFAITDVPISTALDLTNGVCYFLPLFLFVVILWRQVGEILDVHPAHDRRPQHLITALMFVAILVPATVKIDVIGTGPIHPYAGLMTAAMLASVFALLAIASKRATRVHGSVLHPADRLYMERLWVADLFVALTFVASIAIPSAASIWVFPVQRICWIGAFLVPNIVGLFHRGAAAPEVAPPR